MDLLQAGNAVAHLDKDLLLVLKNLTDSLGSRLAALRALRGFFNGQGTPEGTAAVEAALERLGIAREPVEKLLNQYQGLLDLVVGTLGDVGNRPPIELPLKTAGQADLAGGKLSLAGSADLKAFVEGDFDGQALDGHIAFSADEMVVRVGLEGNLTGSLDAPVNLGTAAGTVGFRGGSRFLLDNYFRHSRAEGVLPALLSDLTDFSLPGRIDNAKDLRSRAAATGGLRIPDQWVHLQAEGNLELQGSLRWSQSAVDVGTLRNEALNLDDAITIRTGLQAAVDFRHEISGTFDVVVCASSEHEDRVRVELHKSRASEGRIGVEVGATVGIEGLDQAAKSVLDGFLPKVTALVDQAEARAGELPDLRKLFAARLDGELDNLLQGQGFIADAEKLLRAVGQDVDLTAKLKEIARESALGLADGLLERADAHLQELRQVVENLVRRYRATLKRIEDALEKAANVKIGVTLAHARQRSRGREAFLVFEIDPQAQPGVFRRMLLGSFQEALRLARLGSDSIRLVDGMEARTGGIQITSSLDITAAGLAINHASILKQDWRSEISLSGDVTLSADSSLTGSLTVFGRTRTLTFFARAAVAGTVAGAAGFNVTSTNQDIGLELTEDLRIQGNRLSDLEKTLVQIGVIPASTSIATELVSLANDPSPSGRLSVTARIQLGAAEMDQIVSTDPRQARLAFARALDDFILEAQLATVDSADGTPLVVWPSVEAFFREVKAESSNLNRNFLPRDSQGRPAPGWSRSLQILLFRHWEYVESFSETLRRLRALRGSLQNLSVDAAMRQLRDRQRELLQASGPLVKGNLLSSRINYVFFKTIFELARPTGGVDPMAVVEYRGKKYVFG